MVFDETTFPHPGLENGVPEAQYELQILDFEHEKPAEHKNAAGAAADDADDGDDGDASDANDVDTDVGDAGDAGDAKDAGVGFDANEFELMNKEQQDLKITGAAVQMARDLQTVQVFKAHATKAHLNSLMPALLLPSPARAEEKSRRHLQGDARAESLDAPRRSGRIADRYAARDTAERLAERNANFMATTPQTYKQATTGIDNKQWEEAIRQEMCLINYRMS